jgi:hypothetical protein
MLTLHETLIKMVEIELFSFKSNFHQFIKLFCLSYRVISSIIKSDEAWSKGNVFVYLRNDRYKNISGRFGKIFSKMHQQTMQKMKILWLNLMLLPPLFLWNQRILFLYAMLSSSIFTFMSSSILLWLYVLMPVSFFSVYMSQSFKDGAINAKRSNQS